MQDAGSSQTQLRLLADQCVMCGLCLPHCPTFARTGLEPQGPRGRIALIRQLALGGPDANGLQADASVRDALQSCLQCRACERVCPASVPYGELIEGARARWFPTPMPVSAAWMTRRPALWAGLAGVAGALLRFAPWPGRRARMAVRARRPLRLQRQNAAATVLFVGCAARSFEARSQQALLDCAQSLGLDLTALDGQGCCGALARHLGLAAEAAAAADRLRQRWERAAVLTVVALDSGCIPSLRRGASKGARVREACRWLLDGQVDWRQRLLTRSERVALYVPCTHRNSVGDMAAVHQLLALMPEIEVIQITEGWGCCGAAGPHLLTEPDRADALAEPIIEQILKARVHRVLTTNVGCALHLAERLALRGVKLPITHPVACLRDRLRS